MKCKLLMYSMFIIRNFFYLKLSQLNIDYITLFTIKNIKMIDYGV